MTHAEAMVYAAAFATCGAGAPIFYAYSKVCALRGVVPAGADMDDGTEGLSALEEAALGMLAEFRTFGMEPKR